MISNVLLINQKGEVVISRIYREGASQKTIDTFRNQVCGVSCASGGADARSRARRPGDLCTGGAWVARGGQHASLAPAKSKHCRAQRGGAKGFTSRPRVWTPKPAQTPQRV